ncbi:hypothetical protein SPRG_12079 [Saprolegnia parasitica CBS 223.65]|uniref:Uncharacterized protein n=1 Tax=Saprolegnia parasitica (strain CBS 223.65) TaxID=695850 RepID=A0A067BUZ6_SAPPC|nr:hypothetical protein SPRG_12079 [Saprolegnia parasitica CBS 223.65]KDO22093.1 hypothetical protein SPRG_12079 [Saprolegnia parasitica CBS 223.65]|eukprot:XP_012207235.1 hypothetical protein SPRG_12079 [Saprolegnia parasitica CBS 223.65]
MAAYYSIAVARAGEIVSRSLIKADVDTTLRSLFGMYEGGKHAIGFMDLAVKAGTRTAVFEQHDATMDLVDLDMPIRLVREICGDVTKFLFQVAPTIVASPALVPPPVATPPTPVATPPMPVAASKPKPVAATRGRKPRKAVVVDSFLRESDLSRIGDTITVAPRVVAKPATKPTVRYSRIDPPPLFQVRLHRRWHVPSVADDDSDIPVVGAAKRACRRMAPSSPQPRRELRIPQVHKTSVARSRTKAIAGASHRVAPVGLDRNATTHATDERTEKCREVLPLRTSTRNSRS